MGRPAPSALRAAHAILPLGLALALGGCALLRRVQFERPTVELASVRVTGLGLSGGSVVLGLDVSNPNAYALRSLELRADLTLEETYFGEATLLGDIQLPPEATTRVEVPMRFTWEGVGAAARGLLARGSVDYVLGGQALVDTPLGEQWVRIAHSGMASIFN